MTSATALFYMCSFTMGNFTYFYRCRIVDRYCCGHTCCFKKEKDDTPHLLASWYFWSLILVVFVVFGCIIVSFALSSLKQKADINTWSAFAGTAFNHLATTVIGRQGIIQPKVYYHKNRKKQSNNTNNRQSSINANNNDPDNPRRGSIPAVSSSEQPPASSSSSKKEVNENIPSVSGAVKYSETISRHENRLHSSRDPQRSWSSGKQRNWIEIQMTPLTPAYKSSWTGNQTELRLAASTQNYFPPGFIDS